MRTSISGILTLVLLLIGTVGTSCAALPGLIEQPPLSERWFGIYLDNERVGFYRQQISETADGYRIDGDGSVYLRVMGYSKEASTHEAYQVSKGLGLRSFEFEQTINGATTRATGSVAGGTLRIKQEQKGKEVKRQLRVKVELYPGPTLNIYPLLREVTAGKSYRIQTFDPEELKIKDVKISVVGPENSPDGQPAIKLTNTLYPFVSNDIWVDRQGNTLLESVRSGLVTTRAEERDVLASYVGDHALSKKDLIYDFSLVPVVPPISDSARLTGLSLEISGWNDALPLLSGSGQRVEKRSAGRVAFKTGVFAEADASSPVAADAAYLQPADKIESDAPEIVARATALAKTAKGPDELARLLAAWTADWLKDSVDDGGSAVASLASRSGNCQTHARLYIALARSAGLPSRFVSGLVYQAGKGFLYHSWAESFIGGRWIPVDPTYNQFPADPSHLKLLEGHLPADLAPIITIIGRVSIHVLEARY